MDKRTLVLLVLQLLVTFTSTAHHKAKDLGSTASNFFEGLDTPVKQSEAQMQDNKILIIARDDHEKGNDEDANILGAFVNHDMDGEDSEVQMQDNRILIIARDDHEKGNDGAFVNHDMDGEDSEVQMQDNKILIIARDDHEKGNDEDTNRLGAFVNHDIDGDDRVVGSVAGSHDVIVDEDIHLMDMDLEKHFQMYQTHGVNEPVSPQHSLNTNNDDMDPGIKMSDEVKMVMSPKMSPLFVEDEEIDWMDMDIEKHVQIHQTHDGHETVFPHHSSGTKNYDVNKMSDGAKVVNMSPKMDNMFPKIKQMDNVASQLKPKQTTKNMHGPQIPRQYSTFATTTIYGQYDQYPFYRPKLTYAQEHNEYPNYEFQTSSKEYNEYPTPNRVSYVPVVYEKKQIYGQEHEKQPFGNEYNKYPTYGGIRYLQVYEQKAYKQQNHGRYKFWYPVQQ